MFSASQTREIMEQGTNIGAAGAVSSPFWWHYLEATASLFTVLAPILGGLWFTVQIWAKIATTWKELRDE